MAIIPATALFVILPRWMRCISLWGRISRPLGFTKASSLSTRLLRQNGWRQANVYENPKGLGPKTEMHPVGCAGLKRFGWQTRFRGQGRGAKSRRAERAKRSALEAWPGSSSKTGGNIARQWGFENPTACPGQDSSPKSRRKKSSRGAGGQG